MISNRNLAVALRPAGVKSLDIPRGRGAFCRKDTVVGLAVCVLANALLWVFWPQPYARERRYLESLEQISNEAHELRSRGASDTEWREFAERSRPVLDAMVPDLQKSAHASEPIEQQLLWTARDLIPKTFGPRNAERDKRERRSTEYLRSVREALDRR